MPNPVLSASKPVELEGSPFIPLTTTTADLEEGSSNPSTTTTQSGADRGLCAHCTHIVQALDCKGRVDSPEATKFICDLTQQVLDLRSELKRTKQDLQSAKQ